jgi:PEP-CTERM motif
MRKSWLIAAVVGGAAAAAQAADVQLFGIHIPQTNQYAVYSRISNPASATPSPGLENVAGISSMAVDVLNNGSATVATSLNTLPTGDTNDATAIDQKYGFWLFRSDGTIGGTGATNIRAAQFAEFAPGSAAQYNQYVLQGVGLASGSKAVGGPIVTPTIWAMPVLVAKGTYTGSAGTTGLKLQFTDGTGVNLLKDTDASGAVNWSGPGNLEGAASATVVDAKSAVPGNPLTPGTTTTKAGLGDANLDGTVGFIDLVALAQNYDSKGKSWFQGDFNLDNEVNFNDLVLLAQNYGQPVPAAGTFGGSFDDAVAAAFAQVPEPASLGVIGLGALSLVSRRRRK